jgi:twinkle protein
MKQHSVKEISDMLANKVLSVVTFLLPGGKETGGNWVCGDIRGGEGRTLTVHLSGPHVGKWIDWASPEHKGDLLDLWAATKDLPLPEAIKEAKGYLGISESLYEPSKKVYAAPKVDATKPMTEEGRAMQFLTQTRGISKEIVQRFKVEAVPESKAIAFPCYSPTGKLINRSYRTVPSNGEKKKVWQDAGCAPCLFGWHALSETAFLERTILLSEGQIDCMTWTQWGIDSLSIPNGTGAQWIEYEWENLASFDHIYLSFDMDGAGAENMKKVIQRLGVHRCLIVTLPEKDANDCLLAGRGPYDAQEWIRKAKPPTLNGLVRAKDLKQRVYQELKAKEEPYTLKFFRIAWPDAGFYPHPGDLTVWTGFTGEGKTTFLTFYQVVLMTQGQKIFVASMEVKPERTIRKMATNLMQGAAVSEGAIDGFLNDTEDLLVFADVVGYIGQKELLEMMLFAFMRHGCTRFFIDSFMRIKGLEENFPAQGDFMNELAGFAKTYNVYVDLVCHPNKKNYGGKLSAMDIKGSSLIPNNADNIVSVVKNPEKDKLRKEGTLTAKQEDEMHDAEIRIDKQREVGWTGLFKLMFNRRTQRFEPQKRITA